MQVFFGPSISATPSAGFTIFDRDWAGIVVGDHTTQGPSPWSGGDYWGSTAGSGWSVWNPEDQPVGMPHLDTVVIGSNTFQGVRTYNTDAAQWTTPDAYSGEVRDPISQKSYVWNRNNPLSYTDPSGYCAPDSGGSGVCIDFYISTATIAVFGRGDNRGPSGNFTRSSDRYRVRVELDFPGRRGTIEARHSYSIFGNDLGKGNAHDSSITFVGGGAFVHVNASCGPCDRLHIPGSIRADFFVQIINGRAQITGVHTSYPSMEIYQYMNGVARQILAIPETNPGALVGPEVPILKHSLIR